MNDYEPTSPGDPESRKTSGSTASEDGLGALIGSMTGLHIGTGSSYSAGAAQSVATGSSAGELGSGGKDCNAGSGPATRGCSGTIWNVTRSSFTLTTSAGQEMTVDEESWTKSEKGTSSTTRSAITKGGHVLVLKTRQVNDNQACREADQRRVRGPLHRSQLATPRRATPIGGVVTSLSILRRRPPPWLWRR